MTYAQCQQQIYEWHRGFQRTANYVVRAEIQRRREDRTMPQDERSEAAVRDWLIDALAKGGAAHWGRPNIADVCIQCARMRRCVLTRRFSAAVSCKRSTSIKLCSEGLGTPSQHVLRFDLLSRGR